MNELALLEMAAEQDGFMLVDRVPGGSLVEGVPPGLVWLRGEPSEAAGQRSCDERLDRLAECLRSAISTGFEHVEVQDVGFGLRQLTDVACRALSPGVRDPTTAVHALGHSAAFLSDCAGRRLGPVTLCDDDGVSRVTRSAVPT